MSTETRAVLATAFAALAVIAALASATLTAIVGVNISHSIQTQRVEAVAANCRDVNQRHDNTIKKLDSLIADLPADRRQRAKTGRPGTVLLIDALAPKRDDCQAYARSVVHP